MTKSLGPEFPTRLLIADDHSLTRRALRVFLETDPWIAVVGEAGDGEEAVMKVAELNPDLVLLDVWMPRLDGIAATARIKARWPAIRVVTQSVAPSWREQALAAGADAFVVKGCPVDELLTALRSQPAAA